MTLIHKNRIEKLRPRFTKQTRLCPPKAGGALEREYIHFLMKEAERVFVFLIRLPCRIKRNRDRPFSFGWKLFSESFGCRCDLSDGVITHGEITVTQ
ncbi:MAG TPA: hypothetical protein VFL96_08290, partial [Acidobacteriaceae bacterium]|nr:hypothetical protein [Acidobacteriaceae bacterium]